VSRRVPGVAAVRPFMAGHRRSRLLRAGWGAADQAFSSLTNFALGILIARTVSADDFGAFSLAFATYTIILNVARAAATTPLIVRYSGLEPDAWRPGARAAMGMSFTIGLASGAACLLVGLVAGGALREAFVALGLTMPGLIVQDSWRFAFFSTGHGTRAFANDVVWAIVLFPAFALLTATGRVTVFWPVVAWGGAATVAAVLGARQAGLLPAPRRTRAWWREHVDLSSRYLGELAANMTATQASMYVLGIVAGLGAVGALRAGQLLLGPLNILYQGVQLVAIPEAVSILRSSVQRLRQVCILLSVFLGAVATAWGLLLLAIPDDLGVALLGHTWANAREVILPLSLSVVAASLTTGAYVALRALAAARRSLRANVMGSTIQGIGIVAGSVLGGAPGAAWGWAATNVVGFGIWWREAFAGLADFRRPGPTAVPPEEPLPPA